MNDAAIRNFCIWARNALRQQVEQLLIKWSINEDANSSETVIEGKPLSKVEQTQRADLIERMKRMGRDQLIETAAYTWFNRFIAIRYMEVNDLLPSRTRLFSNADGTFGSLAVKDAFSLDIEGLDHERVLELMQAGDDEELFRYLFLAECNELAECLPDVFEKVGSAMELLLPAGLLRQGSVIERLVDDIPEDDWRQGVEIVGWMYQYYISERKNEVFAGFKKGKKAESSDIAPATQLFTPDWIVRYLTENSLGRLWMQTHPKSSLAEQMPYFIPDADESQEFASAPSTLTLDCEDHGEVFHDPLVLQNRSSGAKADSPESIAVIDPACGSGHILVCAFRLLAAMYEEAGYGRRDIPRLILKNNLTGCEIDPRAAQLASFALAMTACEWDSRYLRRDEKIRANIVCLRPAEISPDELEMMPYLADRAKLLDAMAHMEECGSLFVPEPEDIEALETAAYELDGRMAGGDLLAYAPNHAVETMLENCEPLARKYDVVIANPPYMGSKNMNKWLGDWTKKNYPDAKGDLFSCFIERNLSFSKDGGELGFMTPYVWMFIGTYEKLRNKLINEATITSLIQLEYSGFAGATVPICTFTLQKGKMPDYQGGYVRLSDFVGAANQEPKALEAIADPDCGWFYRRNADSFKAIPGSPIAYWASDSAINAFQQVKHDSNVAEYIQGLKPAPVEKYVFQWQEVSSNKIWSSQLEPSDEDFSFYKWYFVSNGGDFRKWNGNQTDIVNWLNKGESIRNEINDDGKMRARVQNERYYFKDGLTWSALTCGNLSVREHIQNGICCGAGYFIHPIISKYYLLGFLNSKIAAIFKSILSQTLNNEVGDLFRIPIIHGTDQQEIVQRLVEHTLILSKSDWDSFETSWDFQRHPMV